MKIRVDGKAVRLAVLAHVRHRETDYDELLARGIDRHDARSMVKRSMDLVMEKWTS